MKTLPLSVLLLALPLLPARAQDIDFAGRYGHSATAQAGEPVWALHREGDGWRAQGLGDEDGGLHRAAVLGRQGRERFWEKMLWPVETAAAAQCLGWGQTPGSLEDLLSGQTPPGIEQGGFGNALICHVPAQARRDIDWLAGHEQDWFYYDPVAGVMEIIPLR
jgi:hypothetical protein